ncbi:MAG: hypothetical protein C0613_01015 [Desulfobulbaceae bacterium]|nr:MAG: hypothetical protein C0613_01015 [Desulfobulbaceae bacterium]
MHDRLTELLNSIRRLEQELRDEFAKKQQEYFYEIRNKKVYFKEEIRRQNRNLIKKTRYYLKDASLLNILTAPLIWSCLLPALFLDLMVTIYHAICFPVYGIPKVKRDDYIVFDRHYLSYLNWIEKLNCCYCGYFNGLIAYVQEIAARTEQYWCPIKHARRVRYTHSRYKKFFDYGDARSFRRRNKEVRRDFSDIGS